MKYNFKKFLAGTLVVLSFLPMVSFAKEGSSMGKEMKKENHKENKKGGANFCENISTIQTHIADKITKTESLQGDQEKKRGEKVAKKESDADARRAQGRSEVDGKRLKNWDKLGRKATTDAEKAAVSAYKTAIDQAVTARRSAVDAAVKAYRDGLTVTMTTNSTTLTQAMATFKATIDEAVKKAQADCTNKVESKTVGEAFYKSVDQAKAVLKEAKKNAEMSSGLTTLKKTRDEAIKAAEAIFKTATEKARADLALVLKK